MPAGTVAAPATEALDALVDDARSLATRLERDDLAERLGAIGLRAGRTDTVVCVVGEFKRARARCQRAPRQPGMPGHDDLATAAVTVVRYGETPSATVHRREEGRPVVEGIDPSEVPAWAQEVVGRERRQDVDLVEVRLPHPLLEGGLTVVDTPGVGGLNCGHAAATLAFLPSADALVFVTDASAELSGPSSSSWPAPGPPDRQPRSPSPRSTSTPNGDG